jgi:hypothetical protein
MDSAYIAIIISVGCGIVFGTLAYLLAQRDNQRQLDITKLEVLIEKTAKNVFDEKEKTAALVLSEARLNASLVLSEREKQEARFKLEYDELEEKFTEFRIMIAKEYATTTLVKEILLQFTVPIAKKLDEIEKLLDNKVNRREFDEHRFKAEAN